MESTARALPTIYVGSADTRPFTDLSVRPRLSVAPIMRDFDEFYAEHRDEIGRALVLVLGDQSLGQEAVDEAMVKAFQKWDEVGAMASPAGWVFVAGKRWGLSWRRGRRRERKREEFVADRESTVFDRSTADYIVLTDALDELSPDQRTIVACRFSLGMSVAETSEVLGIKEGTVKSRLARSVLRLRELMEEDQ